MHLRQITAFRAQHRWLVTHPLEAQRLGFTSLPHRTSLARRTKALATFLRGLIAFVAQETAALDEAFAPDTLATDKSLFKAQGPVWHQKQRLAGVVPEGLRHLDTNATWSKSGYHGWVYGYGLHLATNAAGFPQLAQVETASVSEAAICRQQEAALLSRGATTLVGDDAYTNLPRVTRAAKAGVAWLAPGLRLGNGPKQQAYKKFIGEPENAALLSRRKTMIEPVFDLVSQLAFASDNHKQLPVSRQTRVETHLLLAVWLLQIAMIVNSIYGLPLRGIGHLMSVLT